MMFKCLTHWNAVVTLETCVVTRFRVVRETPQFYLYLSRHFENDGGASPNRQLNVL